MLLITRLIECQVYASLEIFRNIKKTKNFHKETTLVLDFEAHVVVQVFEGDE